MGLLIIAICLAFIILFLHSTIWEGMLFEDIHEKTYNWPKWLKKPLFDCPICMAPWVGSLLLAIWGISTGSWLTAPEWIAAVLVAGGINTFIVMASRNGE